MRNAFIFLCGLFTVAAAWALYRDAGFRIRESRTGGRDEVGTRGIEDSAKRIETTRAGLEAIIESNRARVAADAGDRQAARFTHSAVTPRTGRLPRPAP
jgi:hypothetical protein